MLSYNRQTLPFFCGCPCTISAWFTTTEFTIFVTVWQTLNVSPDTGPVWWHGYMFIVSRLSGLVWWSWHKFTDFTVSLLQVSRLGIYTAIVIYTMTDPWPDMMPTCWADDHLYSCWNVPVSSRLVYRTSVPVSVYPTSCKGATTRLCMRPTFVLKLTYVLLSFLQYRVWEQV